MLIIFLILGLVLQILWIICSILVYGIEFAYYQKHWPSLAKIDYKKDKDRALRISYFGFLG